MRDEMDELFRKTLDALPDTSPANSTFDADALWSKLDGELRPRRRITGWWVAASVTLLLLIGAGWWWNFSGEKERQVAVQQKSREKSFPANVEKTPIKANVYAPVILAKKRVPPSKRAVPHWSTPPAGTERVVLPTPAAPKPLPAEWPAPTVPSELISESVATVGKKLVFPEKMVIRPEPRFRVVPANEILVEEEARPKLHRNEGFVRVFIGAPVPTELNHSEPHRPLILSTKTVQ